MERLSRLLGKLGPDELCCEDLTQRQCSILRILVDSEGARLSDLAVRCGITASALTRVLERLEERCLVERVRDAQKNGRVALVRITKAGRRTRMLLDELMRERSVLIIESVPSDQRAQVLQALKTLNDSIEAIDFCGLNSPVTRPNKGDKPE